MRYQIVAETYRDLEAASGRLELIRLLADLIRQTPDELLPTVALLCQGQIAPDFAGVELGMAERLAARAAGQVAGVPAEEVLAVARETGDLGLAAERLLAAVGEQREATLEVEAVFAGLHQVAEAQGPARSPASWPGWSGCWSGRPRWRPATCSAPSPPTCAWASAPPPSWTPWPRSTPAAAGSGRSWSGPTTSAPT